MGGTAVQAALALQNVGFSSIVHLTDDSKEVCEILKGEIFTVSPNGELIFADQVDSIHKQEAHGIIQFRKGDVIRLKDQTVEIPESNRLILC